MPKEVKDNLYKPQEVAALLRVGVSTIRNMCASGQLGTIRVGKHYRVLESELRRKYPNLFQVEN